MTFVFLSTTSSRAYVKKMLWQKTNSLADICLYFTYKELAQHQECFKNSRSIEYWILYWHYVNPFILLSLYRTFLALLIFLSIAGNILVCVAIYTERSLRRIGNLFLASLAIADLFVASLVMTFAGVNDILGEWNDNQAKYTWNKFWS